MKARLTLFLTVAVLATLVILPATASASITLTPKEKRVIALVNKIRTKRDLPKLRVKPCLVRAARAHSAEMGAKQYFDHDSHNGDPFSRRLIQFRSSARLSFWRGREHALALASIRPEIVVDNWMPKKGHRAVILTRCFRNIGIGVEVATRATAAAVIP